MLRVDRLPKTPAVKASRAKRPVRLALITEIISPYRVPFLNALGRDPRISLEVLFLAETEDRRQWRSPRSELEVQHRVLSGLIVGRRYQSGALFFNPALPLAIVRGDYEVIALGGYHHPSYWLGLAAARLTRRRSLLWSESSPFDHRPRSGVTERLKRALVRGFDGFVAAGTPQKQYLTELGAPALRIWVAPDAVDNQWFAQARRMRRRRSGHDLRVLYVGRLIRQKGVQDLIEAIARKHQEVNLQVQIVGDGPDRTWLEALSDRLGVGAVVQFEGFLQDAELLEAYAKADLFVFPTHSDPWGLAVNEAMAAGLPILCSNAAGCAADLIREGQNGFTFSAGDVQGLAELLRWFALHPNERSAMGDASAQLIQRHSPERMAEAFAEAVLGVCSLQPVGPGSDAGLLEGTSPDARCSGR